jgi:type II secretory pathway pseudopilin PulG
MFVNKLRKIKYNMGFTLIETVVYVSLFTLISIGVLSSIGISSKIYRTARVNNLITQSGNTAMERITRSIRSASSISANSVLGSALGVLELVNPDGSIVKIYISNGAVVMNENGALSGNLTNQNLNVPSLFFYQITTPNGSAIKTELLITYPKTGVVKKFQTTTILRNSY